MDGFFNLFGGDDDSENQSNQGSQDNQGNQSNQSNQDNQGSQGNETLQLHKEQLDITKSRVQKGEVELGKEIIEEQQTVDVPVMHEEVVIERTPVNNQSCETPISDCESIRIPVSEEQVNVDKKTVVTEEISARKQQVEETQQIDETVRREEARIRTTGNANIVNQDNSGNAGSSGNTGGSDNSGQQ